MRVEGHVLLVCSGALKIKGLSQLIGEGLNCLAASPLSRVLHPNPPLGDECLPFYFNFVFHFHTKVCVFFSSLQEESSQLGHW